MRQFLFTDEEVAAIEYERFHHSDPIIRRRMEILCLKVHDETHRRIATLAGVSLRTVQRVMDMFLNAGLDGVRSLNWHRPVSELIDYREIIETDFPAQPPHTISEACDRIEKLTGLRRGETQVRQFLREVLGMRWLKVSAIPVPPKKSIEEHAANQADFLKGEAGTAT